MSKSTPKAPDYTGAAQEQAKSSREVTEQQTWANRPDQVTPWGSQTWENQQVYDPSTGQNLNRWTQTTELTPETQAALDAQMQLQQQRSELGLSLGDRMRNEYGQAMDWGSLTDTAATPDAQHYDTQGLQNVDPSQRYYSQAGDAVYNQWAQRALPQQQRDTDALRTQLYNQGLREGDAAYDTELERLRQAQGDAQQQAAFGATQAAGSEAQRMYGMDSGTRQQQLNEMLQTGAQSYGQQMQSAQYQNQLRQQQIAEAMQQRGFSLNEINALLYGQQVAMPSMPGFSQAQRSEGVQSLQAAQMTGQAELDRFNAKQQAMQGMMSGIGSMVGGGAMMSERRFKKHIRRIGTTPGGVPLYRFRYVFGGPLRIGVMADEAPAAAIIHMGGVKLVDYSKVT